MPASAFQGAQTSITVSSAQAQLQRIPGIASALAAAVAQAQAQQQQVGKNIKEKCTLKSYNFPPLQHQINNVVWQAASGTPPIVPTPSVTPANNASSTTMALPPQLGTPPTIQQPLAQRLLCSSANSTLSLSGGSKSSSSSSGVSSAASSGNSNSLQSPTAVGGSGGTFRVIHERFYNKSGIFENFTGFALFIGLHLFPEHFRHIQRLFHSSATTKQHQFELIDGSNVRHRRGEKGQ
jgi:hypothetical protein